MARRRFPEGPRLAYQAVGGVLNSKIGSLVRIYTDAACTTLANIQTLAGVAITNSELTIDGNSQFPEFLGPDGTPFGPDVLYAKGVGAATAVPLFARTDERLDPLEARSYPIICTSTTRPASPTDGMPIYETDTNRRLTWNGTVWELDRRKIVQSATSLNILNGWTESTPFYFQAGTATPTFTTGSGNITWPEAFPNGLLTVIVSNGDSAVSPFIITSTQNATRTGTEVILRTDTGASPSGVHRINYIAVGW